MKLMENILLVGLGSIGNRHLSNLKGLLPHAKLTILRSSEGVEPIYGCEVVSSIEDALAVLPQVAVICNPSSFHLGVATKLAEAGVHLFIEKPLSNSLDGVGKFLDVVCHQNIKVMVGYNLRFSLSLKKFKSLISSGGYGRALYATAEVGQYLPDWRQGVDYRSTVSAKSELGGGVLLELSHELDYLSWLFGDVEYASGRIFRVSDLDIDVEDLVLAHVGFTDGNRQLPCSIQMDYLQRKPYRSCKVVCEQATLHWDAVEDRVVVNTSDETKTEFQGDKDRNYTYETELMEFFKCIENNAQVPIPVEDGRKILELVDALQLSSETGKVVYLR